MKILYMLRAALALCFVALTATASAQIAVPPIKDRVTDLAATLTNEQKATLEQSLRAFEAKKGSQLAILIVPTTAPETIEQYALRVAEKWKLGRKNVDDGAILLVAKNDRALRIEVGYGLEGALNDATSKRIISETITPYFKQENFYAGIKAGTDQMMLVVDGEPLPPKPQNQTNDVSGFQQYAPILFIAALVIGSLLRALFGRVPGALVTGCVVGIIAWLVAGAISMALVAGVMALFFTLLSGSLGLRGIAGLGGYYGGSGRGAGGGGGFSGGGGSFGGGGASGRW